MRRTLLFRWAFGLCIVSTCTKVKWAVYIPAKQKKQRFGYIKKRDLTLRALVQGLPLLLPFYINFVFWGQSYISIKVEHAKHKEKTKRISGLNFSELSQSQHKFLTCRASAHAWANEKWFIDAPHKIPVATTFPTNLATMSRRKFFMRASNLLTLWWSPAFHNV